MESLYYYGEIMRKILFICNSSYQIMISAIMKELEYGNDECYLALEDYLYRNTIEQMNFKKDFFNEVFCVKDLEVPQFIEFIRASQVEKIHIFNWGNECSKRFFYAMSEKIELLDEGLGSYQLNEIWRKEGIDLEKVAGMWLLFPELLSQKYNFPIYKIGLSRLCYNGRINSEFIKKLNYLFNYNTSEFSDIIYFDRYFVSGNMLPTTYEKHYLQQLISIVSGYNFIVKIHPSEYIGLAEYRYRDFNVRLYTETIVPWELVLINSFNKKTFILISINSTPIILSKLWAQELNCNIESICLLDIVREYIDKEECYIDPLIAEYNKNANDKIYCVGSFFELKELLSKFNLSKTSLNNKITLSAQNELEWLRTEYISYSKMFGNLIEILKVAIYDSFEEMIAEHYVVYSLKDVIVNRLINVELDSRYNSGTIVIALSKHNIVTCKNVLKIVLYKNNIIVEQLDLNNNENEYVLNFTNNFDLINIQFEIRYPIFTFEYKQLTN